MREKEGTIQKLCLDQEALANKCGELAKVFSHTLCGDMWPSILQDGVEHGSPVALLR